MPGLAHSHQVPLPIAQHCFLMRIAVFMYSIEAWANCARCIRRGALGSVVGECCKVDLFDGMPMSGAPFGGINGARISQHLLVQLKGCFEKTTGPYVPQDGLFFTHR